MVTAVWFSSAVENTLLCFGWDRGIFWISLVITPPAFSIPKDKGVKSSNKTSFTSPCNTPPWMAARYSYRFHLDWHPYVGSLPNIFLNFVLHFGHTCFARRPESHHQSQKQLNRHLNCSTARPNSALNKLFDQTFQFGAGYLDSQMFGSGCIGGYIRQINFRLLAGWQLNLVFSAASFKRCNANISFFKSYQSLSKFINQVFNHTWVKVFTAEESITISRQHFKLMLAFNLGNFIMEYQKYRTQVIHRYFPSPSFLSIPKANAAAVGSLIMRFTSKPAIRPASLVAWRCESLK